LLLPDTAAVAAAVSAAHCLVAWPLTVLLKCSHLAFSAFGWIATEGNASQITKHNPPACGAAAAGMRSKAAPSTSAAAAPKAKAVPKPAETSGGDLDPRSVALPGTLVLTLSATPKL
jgi:hypothetical protein